MYVFVHILHLSWKCEVSAQEFYLFSSLLYLLCQKQCLMLRRNSNVLLHAWVKRLLKFYETQFLPLDNGGEIEAILQVLLQNQNKGEVISLTSRSGSGPPPKSSSSTLRLTLWWHWCGELLTCLWRLCHNPTASPSAFQHSGCSIRVWSMNSWSSE